MPHKLRCLALAALLATTSVGPSFAADAARLPSTVLVAQSGQPAAPAVVAADPDAGRRQYNRWMLSVSIFALAGALVGTAAVTSTPLIAGTAMVYAAAPAVVATTAAVGGYLGALWVDY
jgi:hypothetical protein